MNAVVQNLMAAAGTIVYVKAVIGICAISVRRCWLAPRISRKVIHIAAGSWILFWPFFTTEHWTWRFNVLVPVVYSIQLFVKGFFLRNPNDNDVQTMTRTGSPTELLNGPLCFTLSMTMVGLFLFRSLSGVVIMSCLGFGDGIAPLVGYYFPWGRYPTIPFGPKDTKTLSGSLGCFLGSIVGFHLLRFVAAEEGETGIVRVAAFVAIAEGISGPYDNLAIVVVSALAWDAR